METTRDTKHDRIGCGPWSVWDEVEVPWDIDCHVLAIDLTAEDLAARARDLACQLRREVEAAGAVGGVERFVDPALDLGEFLDRRAVVVCLALMTPFEPEDLPVPPKSHPQERRRLLRPMELFLVRWCAAEDDRDAVLIALHEAGSAVLELATARVEVTDEIRATGVLAGSRGIAPRTVELPAWSVSHARRLVHGDRYRHDSRTPLYGGKHTDDQIVSQKLHEAVRRILDSSQLDGTATALSIRNTALRSLYEQAGLTAAAAASGFGFRRLDALRIEIGLVPHGRSRDQNR